MTGRSSVKKQANTSDRCKSAVYYVQQLSLPYIMSVSALRLIQHEGQ